MLFLLGRDGARSPPPPPVPVAPGVRSSRSARENGCTVAKFDVFRLFCPLDFPCAPGLWPGLSCRGSLRGSCCPSLSCEFCSLSFTPLSDPSLSICSARTNAALLTASGSANLFSRRYSLLTCATAFSRRRTSLNLLDRDCDQQNTATPK